MADLAQSTISTLGQQPASKAAPPTQVLTPSTNGAVPSAKVIEASVLPSDRPVDAPEHCPGTESVDAGKASSCAGCANQYACLSAPKGPDPDLPEVARRMSTIKHKILVLSGKGGVGKVSASSPPKCPYRPLTPPRALSPRRWHGLSRRMRRFRSVDMLT